MPHPDDYQYYLNCGCRDVSHILGMRKMPEGYALMIDADDMFFFGMDKTTGVECNSTWDKWGVYRWAKSRAIRAKEAGE